VISRSARAFVSRTASGSKLRSSRVLAVETASSDRGVHDLAGRLPDPGEVEHQRGQAGLGVHGLPAGHLLVQPPPVQVRADRPLEVVDEAEHLVVRHGPVVVALLVGHVAVEGRDRHVEEPGHDAPFC
jgi:hypothetical protein